MPKANPRPSLPGLGPGDLADLLAAVWWDEANPSGAGGGPGMDGAYLERIEVRRALRTAREGAYGLCADCREPIALARLSLSPPAMRCESCQDRLAGAAHPHPHSTI